MIKSVLSSIYHAIYRAVRIQPTHFSYDKCQNTCSLFIIIKSKVWPICQYVGLGHETMVCAVCVFIFLWEYIIRIIDNLQRIRIFKVTRKTVNLNNKFYQIKTWCLNNAIMKVWNYNCLNTWVIILWKQKRQSLYGYKVLVIPQKSLPYSILRKIT